MYGLIQGIPPLETIYRPADWMELIRRQSSIITVQQSMPSQDQVHVQNDSMLMIVIIWALKNKTMHEYPGSGKQGIVGGKSTTKKLATLFIEQCE